MSKPRKVRRRRERARARKLYPALMPLKLWRDDLRTFEDVRERSDSDVRPEVAALLRAYRAAATDDERATIRAQAERLLAEHAGH